MCSVSDNVVTKCRRAIPAVTIVGIGVSVEVHLNGYIISATVNNRCIQPGVGT